MNDVPIQIRNPDVIRAIRQLAAKKRQPITEVIGDAVNAELSRIETGREAEIQRRVAAVRDIARRFNKLPVVGPMLTDDDLYDEDGLPK
jgi:hypothetical protein